MPITPLRLDPKSEFIADKSVASQFSDLVATPMFHRAAAHAMLTYQFELGKTDPLAAAAASFKLRGAKEFLDTLMRIGEPDMPRATSASTALEPDRNPNEQYSPRLTP